LSQPTNHANKILVSIFLIVKATILDTHGRFQKGSIGRRILNWRGYEKNVWPKFKPFSCLYFLSLILESESLMFPSFSTFQKLFIIQFCNNAIEIIITEIKFSPSSLQKRNKNVSLCYVEMGSYQNDVTRFLYPSLVSFIFQFFRFSFYQ